MLIKQGADTNFRDPSGQSLLCIALTCGYMNVADLLIKYGVGLSVRDQELLKVRGIDVTEATKKYNATRSAEENVMIMSARKGDYLALKQLIAAGFDVNVQDNDGFTPLHIVLENCYLDCVHALFYGGVDSTLKTKQGVTVLHIAAENNYANLMPQLIRYQLLVNESDENGITPLHIAVRRGHHPAMKVLLLNGANVNARDKENLTPLHIAVANCDTDAVEMLATRGADLKIKTSLGCTPLMVAALVNKFTFEFLIPSREAISEDPELLVALYEAATLSDSCLQMLLSRGVTTNVRVCENTFTPLHLAALRGCEVSVNLLLHYDADVNARDAWGGTPLHCCAWLGRFNCMVLILLRGGVDINAAMNKGWTSLHLAAKEGHTQCVKLLNLAGCDTDPEDDEGNTPLMRSMLEDKFDCMQVLLERRASIFTMNNKSESPLKIAVMNGPNFFNKFISLTNPHVMNNKGQKLTHLLASESEEFLRIVLVRGLAVNTQDFGGFTPIHYAARDGKPGCIKLLLEYGANINAFNKLRETALHLAATRTDADCLVQLLANGADINIASLTGDTALHYAAARGNESGIRYLLKCGAAVNVVNDSGETPVMVARRRNQPASIRVFTEFAGSILQGLMADDPATFGNV
ncbi:ankyrin-1 [Anabrus simplex]|uniref:ankyrin-1 n=1 Tax=Anabrus simplex TaxID=316456 RepID=UPI0035A28C73